MHCHGIVQLGEICLYTNVSVYVIQHVINYHVTYFKVEDSENRPHASYLMLPCPYDVCNYLIKIV